MAIQIDTIRDYPKCGSQCNINMRAYGDADYWKVLEKRKQEEKRKKRLGNRNALADKAFKARMNRVFEMGVDN